MWNDPIVEETRRLRDEYSVKHKYNIHAIVQDLNQWEQEGFPMPAVNHDELQPIARRAAGKDLEARG
jgi:hypothetical protein